MRTIAVTLIAAGVSALTLASLVSADPVPPGPQSPLSNAEQKLLNSGRPLNVVINPDDGQLISVTPQSGSLR
jgi:hypothetical protein